MKAFDDRHILDQCLRRIEDQLEWGPADQWHNDVFNELSELILERTKVSLSPTTLKRVWGRLKYSGAPGINTLNTLARFSGAENWRAFKLEAQAPAPAPPTGVHRKPFPKRTLLYSAAGLLTLTLLAILLLSGSGNRAPSTYPADFSCAPLTEGLPNTVVFDLDLGDLSSDSMFIQQYWDVTKTIRIAPGQKQATGIYYFPGYFRAKLLVDGQILKEKDLFVTSAGWMATLDYDPIPKYLFQEDLASDQFLGLPSSALEEIASNEQTLSSTFHNVGDLGEVSGDDFIWESKFRTVYSEKWAVCQSTRLIVVGTKGALIIPFSIPGCSSENNLMLNDVYVDGKKNDLSAFGCFGSDPLEVSIQNHRKHIRIFANGQEIYSSAYQDPLGKVVGLRYKFLGAGEVLYSRLMPFTPS